MKRLLISTFVLLNILQLISAQISDPGQVFNNLQANVSAVKNQKSRPDSERQALVAKIERSTNIISEKWRQSHDKNVPPDYLQTIKFDSDLLRQIAEGHMSSEDTLAILRDVRDDLTTKAAHARANNGAAETLASKVEVTVKTKKSGQEVGGYLVRCNPRRYADQATPMFVFNNATSPTVRSLPPGNYKMWIEMPDGNEVSSRPITIGGNGEVSQEIVFDLQ
jgi:hypothetical protein